MEEVWVFTAEQACFGDVCDTIVYTFASESAAKKFMEEFLSDDGDIPIREFVDNMEWVTEFDEPDLYRAYKKDSYPTDHIECMITKCRIYK